MNTQQIIDNYKIDSSLVDTEEKAKANFQKSVDLFKKLCPENPWWHNYTTTELLDLSESYGSAVESVYSSKNIHPYTVRTRLHIPRFDRIDISSKIGIYEHVPVLTTGDHLEIDRDTFNDFVSLFIQEGIQIRFNL